MQGVFHAGVGSAQVASWWSANDQDVNVTGLGAGLAEESRRPGPEDQRLLDPRDAGELGADDQHGTERASEDLHEGLVVGAGDVGADQARTPHPAVFEQARADEPVDLTQGVRRAYPAEPGEVGDGRLMGGVQQERGQDARLRLGAEDGQERRSCGVHMTYFMVRQGYYARSGSRVQRGTGHVPNGSLKEEWPSAATAEAVGR